MLSGSDSVYFIGESADSPSSQSISDSGRVSRYLPILKRDFSQSGSSSSEGEEDALDRASFVGQISDSEVVSDVEVVSMSCIGLFPCLVLDWSSQVCKLTNDAVELAALLACEDELPPPVLLSPVEVRWLSPVVGGSGSDSGSGTEARSMCLQARLLAFLWWSDVNRVILESTN